MTLKTQIFPQCSPQLATTPAKHRAFCSILLAAVLEKLRRTSILVFAVAGFFHTPALTQQTTLPSGADGSTTKDLQGKPKKVLATILESGSTNSSPYLVAIYYDGSATVAIQGRSASIREMPKEPQHPERTREFPARTINTETMRGLLTSIGDVSKIPTGSCPKAVSFGTTTRISYAGRTSGDLQCIRDRTGEHAALLKASADLGNFVRRTLADLKINARRFRPSE